MVLWDNIKYEVAMAKAVRLDKYLADAGAGTRTDVKKQIQKGQVCVNGCIIKRPETKILPGDLVELNGQRIGVPPEFVYILLHKPAGYVSATEDSREKTVLDLLPENMQSSRRALFPVGRLDKDTEGLLLITDVGAMAHELLSPGKHVEKTYFARIDGKITREDKMKLEEGVDIGEKKSTLPATLEILSVGEQESEILLTIHEGKFHQVKRMTEAVGKKVTYLKRISMGPLILPEELEKGCCRFLTEEEVNGLRQITGKPDKIC